MRRNVSFIYFRQGITEKSICKHILVGGIHFKVIYSILIL